MPRASRCSPVLWALSPFSRGLRAQRTAPPATTKRSRARTARSRYARAASLFITSAMSVIPLSPRLLCPLSPCHHVCCAFYPFVTECALVQIPQALCPGWASLLLFFFFFLFLLTTCAFWICFFFFSLRFLFHAIQMGYQNWLDVNTLNSTPTTYPCLVTNGCPGLGTPSPYTGVLYEYTGPDTVQCEPGYSTTTP